MACPRCHLNPVESGGMITTRREPLSPVEEATTFDAPLPLAAWCYRAALPGNFSTPRICHSCGAVYCPKPFVEPKVTWHGSVSDLITDLKAILKREELLALGDALVAQYGDDEQ